MKYLGDLKALSDRFKQCVDNGDPALSTDLDYAANQIRYLIGGNDIKRASGWEGQRKFTSTLFDIKAIQSDALSWAADQIKSSSSLEEALLKLSVKYQELQKGK